MVNVIKDVDLIDHVSEYDVILVGANIYGHMNGGFQFDVKRRYPYVHEANISAPYGDINRMGTVLESKEDGKPTFCLCYIVDQITTRPDLNKVNVSYESIEKCLKLVSTLYKGKKIASTLLGTSQFDGNGDTDTVLPIFEKILGNEDVTIYDFKQECIYRKWRKAYNTGKTIKKKNGVEAWKRYIEQSKNNLTKKSKK